MSSIVKNQAAFGSRFHLQMQLERLPFVKQLVILENDSHLDYLPICGFLFPPLSRMIFVNDLSSEEGWLFAEAIVNNNPAGVLLRGTEEVYAGSYPVRWSYFVGPALAKKYLKGGLL